MSIYIGLFDRLVAYWTGHHWDKMPRFVYCVVNCFTVEPDSSQNESVVIQHATRLEWKTRQDCGVTGIIVEHI